MSIRMLAVELYRVMKRVEELERKLKTLKPGSPEKEKVEDELRVTKAEERRLKSLMQGAKD